MAPETQITVRPAAPEDRAAVLALVPRLRAFGTVPLRTPEELDAGEERTLRHFFRSPEDGTALWVATDGDGSVIGAAYAEEGIDYFTRERHGHLGILMVDERAEGRGVGRRLLERVEEWASGRGHRFLTLNVFPGNRRAIGIYERAGYAPDAVKYAKRLGAERAPERPDPPDAM